MANDESNNLVVRLRGPIKHPQECVNQRREAADRIEALEKKVDVYYTDRLKHCSDEVQRLEGANAKLRRLNPNLTGYANGYADALADMPDGTFSDAEAGVAIGLQRKEIERLRAALASAEKTFNNIRGAIESNQVVDKDAHGMAVRGRDACRAVLSPNSDKENDQ